MASISSLMSQTSSYESFVTQLVNIESQKMLRMEVQVRDEKESKSAVGTVSKAISDFENIIKELETPSNRSFEPFKTTSSDDSVVQVNSASGLDNESAFNITVERLAKNDTALSETMTGAGYELAAQGDGSVTLTIGDKTETINVVTTKDDGSGGTVNKTNQEILESFETEIESLFGNEASASVFNLDGENIQFSLKSLETGYDNRIQFSGATGVLAGVTGNMTHLTPQAELDAQFIIDGVTFNRAENTVDDAIEGLSFTMKKATGVAEQMTVERDTEAAKSNLQDFINAYNEMNETIRERTFINPETGNKGPLQGVRSVRNLTINLRQTAILSLGGVAEGEVASFADMGITFENNGKMVIDDSSKLDDILNQNPEQIANFFTNENSPVAMMKARAESYTEADGILSAIESGLDQKIDRLDRRIASERKYLEEYEAEQRRIFNELDLILEEGQAQFDAVYNFMSGY
ncbi:flagellar filament capping protein FliD [Gracilimonas sediminicola]|uniref:flagellar filament capping protein FliD n=1 Tax=Gracilimonas sediminicola TaxID=2952158 RepID=UPI0038D46B94